MCRKGTSQANQPNTSQAPRQPANHPQAHVPPYGARGCSLTQVHSLPSAPSACPVGRRFRVWHFGRREMPQAPLYHDFNVAGGRCALSWARWERGASQQLSLLGLLVRQPACSARPHSVRRMRRAQAIHHADTRSALLCSFNFYSSRLLSDTSSSRSPLTLLCRRHHEPRHHQPRRLPRCHAE